MTVVHDVDRPDVNGVAPKMQGIRDMIAQELDGLVPVLNVKTDDNLMSSVTVSGTFDAKEDWANGIYENSRYFRFAVVPPKGARYYDGGDKVTLELWSKSYKLPKSRKYTGTPAKVAAKLRAYLEANKDA